MKLHLKILTIFVALVAVFSLPKSIFAAIAVDATSSTSGASVSSLTFSHTVGSGAERMLIVGVALRKNGPVVSSVTYGGVGLTLIASQLDGGADHRAELWYLLAPTSGTANIVVTLSATVDATAGAISFAGVNQTAPLGSVAGSQGTDQTPSVTIVSAVGEVVADVMSANGDSGAVAVGANQTQQWNQNTGTSDANEFGAQSTEAGAASVTMSWSLTNANKWAILAVPIKPSPAIAPAAISNLATLNQTINSIDLSWTAPGADDNTGTATSYDIRYSTSIITAGNFSSATQVTGEPTPLVAGSNQSMTVSGLLANTIYYFAIKTSDEAQNISEISNIASGLTLSGDQILPAIVSGGGGNYWAPLPLISVTNVPNPLAMTSGPGTVTYTYTVTNVGTVPMRGIWVKDDKCSVVTFISGDTDKDSQLDLTESWIYQCTKLVSETETSTATTHGSANGWDGYDTANATVVVGAPAPNLPDAGILPPLIQITKVPSRITPFPLGGVMFYICTE